MLQYKVIPRNYVIGGSDTGEWSRDELTRNQIFH